MPRVLSTFVASVPLALSHLFVVVERLPSPLLLCSPTFAHDDGFAILFGQQQAHDLICPRMRGLVRCVVTIHHLLWGPSLCLVHRYVCRSLPLSLCLSFSSSLSLWMQVCPRTPIPPGGPARAVSLAKKNRLKRR